MRKIVLFLILVVLIILTGCSERELTFDREYPNLAIVDEFREKRKLEIEEEIKNAPYRILETRPKPRRLLIYDATTDSYEYAHPSQYCWELNYLECDERMKPVHPYDSSEINLSSMVIGRNSFEVTIENGRGAVIPYPDRIEAYIYDQNKNLQLHQAFDSKSEGQPIEFILTLPSDTGKKTYMLQFKVIYKGDIEGVSYHPFMIFTN